MSDDSLSDENRQRERAYHVATLLRLDCVTNALAHLSRTAHLLELDARHGHVTPRMCERVRESLELAHAAVEIAHGQRTDVPPEIASQRRVDPQRIPEYLALGDSGS